MRPVRIALLIAALGAVQAHAGVFDDDEARRQVTDLKIKTEARFDQQAKAQLDLSTQIQRQAPSARRMRHWKSQLLRWATAAWKRSAT